MVLAVEYLYARLRIKNIDFHGAHQAHLHPKTSQYGGTEDNHQLLLDYATLCLRVYTYMSCF